MATRSFTVLALLCLGTPAAWTQSDSVPYNSSEPVHKGGYTVLHDDGTAVQAFSALTRSFTGIGAPGSSIVGVGDFGGMLLNGTSTITAYSARTNTTAVLALQALETVDFLRVEDDVLFVVTRTLGGDLRVHGYSMQKAAWDTITLGNGLFLANLDFATSRFVIGVRHDQGGLHTLSCFSARQGVWVQQAGLVDVGNMLADGNIFAANVTDNFGQRVYAFSGVHGVGALSIDVVSTTYLAVSHNMAYTRGFDGASNWMGTAFSAYDCVWVNSPLLRDLSDNVVLVMRDNFVALSDGPIANTPRWETIGARPHKQWAQLRVDSAKISLANDALVVREITNGGLHAFSGLANGGWLANNVPGSYTGTVDVGRMNAIFDGQGDLQTFSPARAAWGAVLAKPNGGSIDILGQGDALLVVSVTGGTGTKTMHGYNVRNNDWVAGPNINGTVDTATGGSISSIEDDTGFGTYPTSCYDSRTHSFSVRSVFQDTDLHAGRNLAFQVESLLIHTFSHQRGEWDVLANRFGQSHAPFSVGPVVEENVAYVVDSAGELVAYSSTADIQSIHQYPDGTEYYALAEQSDPVVSTPLRIASRVQPGFLRQYIGSGRQPVPVGLPAGLFTGFLHIMSPYFINQSLNVLPYSFDEVPLPAFVPLNFPFWLQNICLPVPFLPIPLVAGEDPEVFWTF